MRACTRSGLRDVLFDRDTPWLFAEADRFLSRQRLVEGDAVWVFGSRAGRCARRDSDLDILILRYDPTVSKTGWVRRNAGRLDAVEVIWDGRRESSWLKSDLASHVASYGACVSGSMEWMSDVQMAEAGALKTKRVLARAQAFVARRHLLAPRFRARRLLAIRRDVQRAACLRQLVGVPPTAALDSAWSLLGPLQQLGLLHDVLGRLAPAIAEAGDLLEEDLPVRR